MKHAEEAGVRIKSRLRFLHLAISRLQGRQLGRHVLEGVLGIFEAILYLLEYAVTSGRVGRDHHVVGGHYLGERSIFSYHVGNQLERFASDCLAVDAHHIPKRFLSLPFVLYVAEVMLLVPVTRFIEVIVGQDQLTVAVVTIGQEDIVEAFLEAPVKGILGH